MTDPDAPNLDAPEIAAFALLRDVDVDPVDGPRLLPPPEDEGRAG